MALVRGPRVPGGRIERICWIAGLVLIAAGVFHLAVFAVAGGPWHGPVSWRKPITFGLSFGLTLMTVAWLSAYLPLPARRRGLLLAVFAVDCCVEVAGITLQAWRGVPSHINRETAFDSAVSTVLAIGGGVLVVVLGLMSLAAFRARVAPSMRVALRAGFASLLIGLVSGAAMIARGVVEVNGGDQQRAYEVVGFLKPVHAMGLHGVLVLPALAWLLSFTRWDEARRTRAVVVAVAGYGAATIAALAYSLA
ncbi:hypothetical protein [Actinoplanes regularis]|uniref:Uncharacterized protein n=1 Tax=Actinoplanes regularis TaxID=52697 RepID=A0A239FSU2_9ACTN|nr:hypothetical protein [Actinoplanes regularis]GIE90152.1 hypothetical protein Are01nite_66320 [Actinoplanes regularis]SNS59895.1 hypothetical protein SAMN06264365_11933 [Actinoplanes regularis]